VVVLGMHRSGTSAVTKLVSLLGPAVCRSEDLVTGLEWNPKGHWESRAVNKMNNRLLREMDCRWWRPPPLEGFDQLMTTIAMSADEARGVFDRSHPRVPWVWKDPRTCITLPFWRTALAQPLCGVAIFRNPLDVAISLERRHGLAVEFGLALWVRYSMHLLAHAVGLPLLVSSYDDVVTGPTAWSEVARHFLAGTGMVVSEAVDETVVGQFVDADLRHSSHGRDDLITASREARDTVALYDLMRDLAGSHDSFVVPSLSPEPPWVEAQIASVGPEWRPEWNRSPWEQDRSLWGRVRARSSRARS
jgi:hypothetical protein